MIASLIDSPIGPLLAGLDGAGRLVRLDLPRGRTPEELVRAAGDPVRNDGVGAHVRRVLDDYFVGKLTEFDLDTAPSGTGFQCEVWDALKDIPYGATWTYAALAERVGRPGAARAVWRANGQNPVAIVIPCHRVIGADGSLTGYGGGLPAKRFLLELEGAIAADTGSLF